MTEEPKKKKEIPPRYLVEDGKLVRRLKECPRCGTSMAAHSNRFACGKCGYTEFLKETS
ncbi:MAG: 30S ribosomal protein S27ae [Candidatus Bathyarchaeota archaeon]|nr:MAG: 30S ribosomal protein S27ae [Candidatus Bathyarchaeota archaeon]